MSRGGGTDGQTDIHKGSPLCSTGQRPFGAAAQKGCFDWPFFYVTRPDKRPIRSRWWEGSGSNVGEQGQYEDGRGLNGAG